MISRIEPIPEFKKDGVRGTVAVDIDDVESPGASESIIIFGRDIGAIVNDGSGEFIAIQVTFSNGEDYQILFSLEGFCEMIISLYYRLF